jgi:LSD1 subclass zinc finger protein
MSIPFKCTSCGGPLEYEEGGAPTVRCPFCGNSIIVPEELRPRRAAHTPGGGGFFDGLFRLQERAANLQEVARLARAGNKIEAIKLYREMFGVSLAEAKLAVERMAAGEQPGHVSVSMQDVQAHPAVQQMTHKAKRTASWVVLAIVIIIFAGVGVGIWGLVTGIKHAAGVGSQGQTPPPRSGPFDTASVPAAPAAPGFASVALKFGSEGIGPGMFKDARHVGVDGEGRIYVGEYLNGGRVQAFDAGGKFITQWAVDPKMPMRQMTADRKGTVYVVQRGEILRFDGATGDPLGKVEYSGATDHGRAYFDQARATPDGGLVAVLNDDDIVRFDARGKVTRVITKALQTQTGDPERIASVAVDGLGNVYALSMHRSAVFKFSPDGRFVNRFGGPGGEAGQFRAADAVAVDGKGRVFVSDIQGVQVFDSEGRYLDTFKVDGNMADGLAFNDKNELLVAGRTQVLKYILNK